MKRIFLLIIIIISLYSCGTLGHIVFYDFDKPKKKIEENLLKITGKGFSYQSPNKWRHAAIKNDSLDEIFVYFNHPPEEMYEFGFAGDKLQWDSSNHCEMALVGVFKGDKWLLDEDLGHAEKKRMQTRFENEILSKLKYNYTKSD